MTRLRRASCLKHGISSWCVLPEVIAGAFLLVSQISASIQDFESLSEIRLEPATRLPLQWSMNIWRAPLCTSLMRFRILWPPGSQVRSAAPLGPRTDRLKMQLPLSDEPRMLPSGDDSGRSLFPGGSAEANAEVVMGSSEYANTSTSRTVSLTTRSRGGDRRQRDARCYCDRTPR